MFSLEGTLIRALSLASGRMTGGPERESQLPKATQRHRREEGPSLLLGFFFTFRNHFYVQVLDQNQYPH